MCLNSTSRRQLLITGGTVAVGSLSGCLDDGASEEMEAAGDQAGQHIDDAEASLEAAFERNEAEDFEGCLDEIAGVGDDLTAAREEAATGVELAEEAGEDDAIEVFELMLTFIDSMEEITTELESLCEAAIDEDWERAERHIEAIDELTAELDQIGRELDRALAEAE